MSSGQVHPRTCTTQVPQLPPPPQFIAFAHSPWYSSTRLSVSSARRRLLSDSTVTDISPAEASGLATWMETVGGP
eukprot:360109-Chlamydomonas_euryale.AAC.2